MILAKIIQTKMKEVEKLAQPGWKEQALALLPHLPAPRDFRAGLEGRDTAIIAEIKRASPSRGILRENFDPADLARLYESSGAAAISVLTDEPFFQGHKNHLSQVKAASSLPVLRKDFLLDELQILESRLLGADAILLIARIVKGPKLAALVNFAQSLGLAPLVEVHTQEDLNWALTCGAGLVAINNRNLETFTTDLKTTLQLAPLFPRDFLIVSASGISSRADIQALQKVGVRAFLVGESFMKTTDVRGKMRELMGKER
jgi:indole-3-glycerol phosphate synthase